MAALRDQKGAALPLALIITLVMLLLGTALWRYSMADTFQVARDEQRMKAYYLARSGAAATATYIINNPTQAHNLIYVQSQSNPTAMGDGTFRVNVYGTVDHIIIEATGEVAGVEQTAILNLKKASIFDQYVLVADEISLSGTVNVVGDILLPASAAGFSGWGGNVKVEGTLEYDDRDFPDVAFPTNLWNGVPYNINLGPQSPKPYPIFPGFRYGDVNLGAHSELLVHLGSNPDAIRTIRMDTLDLANRNATFRVAGDGILYLYLREFKGRGSGLLIEGDANLVVFVEPGGEFNVSGTPQFMGMVYAPSATVRLGGGSIFKGSIVAQKIVSSGNVTIEYVPLYAPGDIAYSYVRDTWRDQ